MTLLRLHKDIEIIVSAGNADTRLYDVRIVRGAAERLNFTKVYGFRELPRSGEKAIIRYVYDM